MITSAVSRFKMAVVSAARAAEKYNFGSDEDSIVVIAGIPFNMPGTTNILRVSPIEMRLIDDFESD